MPSGCILYTAIIISCCRSANKVSGVLYTTSAWGFRVASSYCGGQCEGLDAWNGRQYGSHAFLLLIFSGGEQGKATKKFEMVNEYIDYLIKHFARKKIQFWKDRQYVDRQYTLNRQITECDAFFVILEYNGKYLGVVEPLRPNSATYLYDFPDENILLYSYIYKTDFADPAIFREPDAFYISRIECINLLLKVQLFLKEAHKEDRNLTEEEIALFRQALINNHSSRIDDISIDDQDENIELIEEELECTHDIVCYTPIKYRDYFIGEIAHRGIDKWSIDLENMISEYVAGKYKKETPQYEIYYNKEDEIDVPFCMYNLSQYSMNYFYLQNPYQLATSIKKEIESNNVIEKIESNKVAKRKKKNNKQINQIKLQKTKEYNSTLFCDKSIKDIAFMFGIPPTRLLSMIQQRISTIHVDSIEDILDINKVSLCQRIIEELWYMYNKQSK